MNSRLKKFFSYKNPVIIAGIAVLLLSIALMCVCGFNLPEFYTNREVALDMAQRTENLDIIEEILQNPLYERITALWQVWGIALASFLFCLIFGIFDFSGFKNRKIFNNKWFIYLWLNISWLVWGNCFVGILMGDLEKYVYNAMHDTMFIPLMSIVSIVHGWSYVYFPSINILAILTFNTRLKRRFYAVFWVAAFALFAKRVWLTWFCPFSVATVISDFILITNGVFCIYALGYKKPENPKTPEPGQPEENRI